MGMKLITGGGDYVDSGSELPAKAPSSNFLIVDDMNKAEKEEDPEADPAMAEEDDTEEVDPAEAEAAKEAGDPPPKPGKEGEAPEEEPEEKSMSKGWVGVDLDGTLAKYDGYKGDAVIGEPIQPMVDRVKGWISEGKEVRIMTARAAPQDGEEDGNRNLQPIKDWCRKNLGKELPITYKKDQTMDELWDDRAIQVKPNTGEPVDGMKKSVFSELDELAKGGPYIGPKGGKWADPQFKIPWKEGGDKKVSAPKVGDILRVIDKHHGDVPAFRKELKAKYPAWEKQPGSLEQVWDTLGHWKEHWSNKSMEGSEPMTSINELEEFAKSGGGAGSRGGKVIGHTSSGKAIYESHGHESHKTFSVADHKDASNMHAQALEKLKAKGKLSKEESEQAYQHHKHGSEHDWSSAKKKIKEKVTGFFGRKAKKSMTDSEELSKGGPYIGPKGGKWADPDHKIPWKEGKGGKGQKAKKTSGESEVKYSVLKSKHGHSYKVSLETTVGKVPIIAESLTVHIGLDNLDEIGDKVVPITKVRRVDGSGKDVTGHMHRKVIKLMRSKFQEIDRSIPDAEKSMDGSGIDELKDFVKSGGPFIGPRGGKWADAKHTIPWKEGGDKTLNVAMVHSPDKVPSEVLSAWDDHFGNVAAHQMWSWDGGGAMIGQMGTKMVAAVKHGKDTKTFYDEPGVKGLEGALRTMDLKIGKIGNPTEGAIHRKEGGVSDKPIKEPTHWDTQHMSSADHEEAANNHQEMVTKLGKLTHTRSGMDKYRRAQISHIEAKTFHDIQALSKKEMGKSMEASMSGLNELENFAKGGGPFIGPRGGKWADPDHKIPWADAEKNKAKGKKSPKPMASHKDEHADVHSITELELFAENDYDTYKQRQAFEANVVKKMASGKYDHAQAPKLWGYFADRVAQAYTKAHGGSFDKHTKQALARKLANDFHDDVKASPGEHEQHVPKKYKKDWGKTKKSMEDPVMESGKEILEDFVEKAQAMPTGEPTMGGSGSEQGGPLAGKGNPPGSRSTAISEPIGDVNTGKKQKLSEDDEDEEKQMKPGKKPIEKTARKSFVAGEDDLNPARQNAALEAHLRKGDADVSVGIGVAPPVEESEPVEKSRTWDQGGDSMFAYSDKADKEAAAMAAGNGFYTGGSPTMALNKSMLTGTQACAHCENNFSKALSACPKCGAGEVSHQIFPGVQLSKAHTEEPMKKGPGLRRARGEQDVYAPNGVSLKDE